MRSRIFGQSEAPLDFGELAQQQGLPAERTLLQRVEDGLGEFADELDKIEPYRIGSVAMANSGPNTNGSQFFIITGDSGTQLPPNYTLFGQVSDDDLSVITALDAVANPADGPPLTPIDIASISIQS